MGRALISGWNLHIPDGFLSGPVALVGWLLTAAAVLYALRQTRNQLAEKQIPLMGVLAAFIFAAQAINFPVAGGTSGHLLGGALAAIIVGPWAAVLIMTCVVGIQGLVFQDGGLLVMGWNIANMGILTAFTGHLVYTLLRRVFGSGRRALLAAGAVGAWLSVMAGAGATAVELAVSGTSPLRIALPAMLGTHLLIGLGEAVITVGALTFVHAARRDLLDAGESAPGRAGAGWVAVGLGAALLLAAFSPLASANPDGLNRVAADLGFSSRALGPSFNLLSGYVVRAIGNAALAKIVAVGFGTLIVFAVALLAARFQGKQGNKGNR